MKIFKMEDSKSGMTKMVVSVVINSMDLNFQKKFVITINTILKNQNFEIRHQNSFGR